MGKYGFLKFFWIFDVGNIVGVVGFSVGVRIGIGIEFVDGNIVSVGVGILE